MILEEFDTSKLAVFNATDFQKKQDRFPKIAVGFFHHDLLNEFIKVYQPEIIATIKSCTVDFNVYKINSNGVDIAVVQAPMGAPYCVAIFEEIVALGAEKILIAGSCGCLGSIEDYSLILPTSAIRDEGTSYHYVSANEEIELDAEVIAKIEDTLKTLGITYSKGKTWTNDAIYRETAEKVARRKEQGAITVEMECSAMAAFAQFRGVKFGQILYAADDLSNDTYDVRSLVDGELSQQAKIIPIVIKCAEALSK